MNRFTGWIIALCLPWMPPSGRAGDSSAVVLSTQAAEPKADAPASPMLLRVLRVQDSDFPAIGQAEMERILGVAKAVMSEKFGLSNLEFEGNDSLGIEEFFARTSPHAEACLKKFDPLRYPGEGRPDFSAVRPLIMNFLKRWDLVSLRGFFPQQQQSKYDSYQAIETALEQEFVRKVELIRGLTAKDGQSLLRKEKTRYRSYVNWICAMEAQQDYDIIFTNTFILYDLLSEPYPHSIFQKCKVGGASLRSPKRAVFGGRAIMTSTFGLQTELPFFRESGAQKLTDLEKEKVLGVFILAHELGHGIFKLPDFFDHPVGCLMTTTSQTGYLSGFEDLMAHPGPCSKCAPWVKARQEFFAGQVMFDRKDYLSAADHFGKSINLTPQLVDGDYSRLVIDVALHILRCYAALGDVEQYARWMAAVKKLDPNNPELQEIDRRFQARPL